jgi:hypothetical protein
VGVPGTFFNGLCFSLLVCSACIAQDVTLERDDGQIKPYEGNPRYWQYMGEPVLLLGGSKDDSLFQIPDLKEHLDLLVDAGGNYVRNTMSSRLDKGFEVQPFKMLTSGNYDLDEWNEEYWERFESMLRLTRDRNVIVQIEVWAFHDFNKRYWEHSPWHPSSNINYSESRTTLKKSYGNLGRVMHDFFLTVPELNNDILILKYQKKYVDRLLDHSLRYDHVLYCITNEIHPNYFPEWGIFWSRYIREKAAEVNKSIYITEMYWETDLKKPQHQTSLDDPGVFSFFEASQNSAKMGQQNWNNLQYVYTLLTREPRPVNHVKIYGADTSNWKGFTDRHATESFWRNMIGGSASSRFHRPPHGLGLDQKSMAHIQSMRLLASEVDFFKAVPDSESLLLSERSQNEAYLSYIPGEQYVVYFPDGGSVGLDHSMIEGEYSVKWLDIENSRWAGEDLIRTERLVTLSPPGGGHWAVRVMPVSQ